MSDSAQFTIAATSDVTIGENHVDKNSIKVTVTNSGATARVKVTLTVKCGPTSDSLLSSKDDQVTPSDNLPNVSVATDSKSWQTTSRGVSVAGNGNVVFALSKFDSKTPPGDDASIDVLVESIGSEPAWTKPAKFTIHKSAPPSVEAKIHYFEVEPDYIVHAGQTLVTVSFYTTALKTITLFRNNQEVQNWSPDKDGVVIGSFTDKPSITTAFRLEGKPGGATTERSLVRYRTVQVISPGWNQIELPQGYPAQLFVNQDFSGGGMERLYGIFIDDNRKAALYSSATGVDDWRPESGTVPKSMAFSPGVAYNNKLWLIGGSCVDPNSPSSSDVWCYEPEDPAVPDSPRRWQQYTPGGDSQQKHKITGDFPPRMGHACVVFQGKLWVLGGYDNPNAFNDVWQLNDDEKGNLSWTVVSAGCNWQGRLNLAAGSFTDAGGGNEEIWVYGGSVKPQPPSLNDLWSSTDGITWSQWSQTSSVVPIAPDPGTPLGATLVNYPEELLSESEQHDRPFLIGSFKEWAVPGSQGNRVSSSLFEWHGFSQVWEERPVFNGWQQFRGEQFYMQAVAFNGFLFVWSLQPNIQSTLKLNILIS